MIKKLTEIFIVFFLSVFVGSCALADAGDVETNEMIITDVIFGSYESPDLRLKKVKELQKAGILTNVRIGESDPLSIRVTGPRSVIEQLRAMPK